MNDKTHFGMDPELVENVQTLVRNKRCGRDEDGQAEVEENHCKVLKNICQSTSLTRPPYSNKYAYLVLRSNNSFPKTKNYLKKGQKWLFHLQRSLPNSRAEVVALRAVMHRVEAPEPTGLWKYCRYYCCYSHCLLLLLLLILFTMDASMPQVVGEILREEVDDEREEL